MNETIEPGQGAVNDDLPERCRYADEGCELAPSCLSCPFPQCVYDVPGGRQALVISRRDAEIARLFRDEHLTVRELARAFGLSRRSVQRAVKRQSEANAGTAAEGILK